MYKKCLIIIIKSNKNENLTNNVIYNNSKYYF